MALYDLLERPELDAPVLLVALEGWIDAGFGAARAVEAILDRADAVHVATFDTDALLDFRARRPILHIVDGVRSGLAWSAIDLWALRSPNDVDVLVLTGVEPDHQWHAFSDAVVDLVADLEVRLMLGLGAYPAPVPHTRPVLLSSTAADETWAARIGAVQGTLDVPAGIQAVLEERCSDRGIPGIGLWAQVPNYASTFRYPAASVRLLEAINHVAGTDFSLDTLGAEVAETRDRIDGLIAANPEHVAMLGRLEAQADAATADRIAALPTGDDLAEELERFLRDEDGP